MSQPTFTMRIPDLVDATILRRMATPDETHSVRVILRQVSNQGPYRLRGVRRHYIFRFDPKAYAHVLDIPISLWMQDAPTRGNYGDNLSIAHDLMANYPPGLAPLVFLVTPLRPLEAAEDIGKQDAPAWSDEQLDLVSSLVARLAEGQDPERFKAMATDAVRGWSNCEVSASVTEVMARHGRDELIHFIESFWPADDDTGDQNESPAEPAAEKKPAPISNAERQRQYRARKRAKAAAAKA